MGRWVGLDLPPALFWDVTPREMAVMMEGATQRIRREQGLAYTVAHLIGYAFHAPRKMPDFDKVFPDGSKRQVAQTPEAIFAAMRAWSQRLGARLN